MQEKEYRRYAPAEYWDNVGAMVSDLDKSIIATWIGDRAAEEVSGWNDEGQLLMAGLSNPITHSTLQTNGQKNITPMIFTLPGYLLNLQNRILILALVIFLMIK